VGSPPSTDIVAPTWQEQPSAIWTLDEDLPSTSTGQLPAPDMLQSSTHNDGTYHRSVTNTTFSEAKPADPLTQQGGSTLSPLDRGNTQSPKRSTSACISSGVQSVLNLLHHSQHEPEGPVTGNGYGESSHEQFCSGSLQASNLISPHQPFPHLSPIHTTHISGTQIGGDKRVCTNGSDVPAEAESLETCSMIEHSSEVTSLAPHPQLVICSGPGEAAWATNGDMMRKHLAKVLFEDVSIVSATVTTSDDDSSQISVNPTPLRMHQAAANRDYIGAPLPSNEGERMLHLCGLNILSSPPEERHDRLTSYVARVRIFHHLVPPECPRLTHSFLCMHNDFSLTGRQRMHSEMETRLQAQRRSVVEKGECSSTRTRQHVQVFNVPIVLLSLVDKDRQWFKSVVGLPGVRETDRKSSFCAWTLLPAIPQCLVVTDARSDARFRNNKLVSGPPFIQFYSGCPLVSSTGLRLGSICAIDVHTRFFTSEDCNLLCNFAELAVREIEAGRASDRRNFGDGAETGSNLRTLASWEHGILVVHIGMRLWWLQGRTVANVCLAAHALSLRSRTPRPTLNTHARAEAPLAMILFARICSIGMSSTVVLSGTKPPATPTRALQRTSTGRSNTGMTALASCSASPLPISLGLTSGIPSLPAMQTSGRRRQSTSWRICSAAPTLRSRSRPSQAKGAKSG
jgi:hypothetical protein